MSQLPTGPAASRAALLVAFAVPAALLGGAYISQHVFGLWPCPMCWWQRYAHFAALAFAGLALVRPPAEMLVRLAGLAILIGGLIGAYHAGIEYGWWTGFTACTAGVDLSGDPLDAILNAPVTRCDVAPWKLFGISLAGYNFLISVPAALLVFVLLGRGKAGRA